MRRIFPVILLLSLVHSAGAQEKQIGVNPYLSKPKAEAWLDLMTGKIHLASDTIKPSGPIIWGNFTDQKMLNSTRSVDFASSATEPDAKFLAGWIDLRTGAIHQELEKIAPQSPYLRGRIDPKGYFHVYPAELRKWAGTKENEPNPNDSGSVPLPLRNEAVPAPNEKYEEGVKIKDTKSAEPAMPNQPSTPAAPSHPGVRIRVQPSPSEPAQPTTFTQDLAVYHVEALQARMNRQDVIVAKFDVELRNEGREIWGYPAEMTVSCHQIGGVAGTGGFEAVSLPGGWPVGMLKKFRMEARGLTQYDDPDYPLSHSANIVTKVGVALQWIRVRVHISSEYDENPSNNGYHLKVMYDQRGNVVASEFIQNPETIIVR